MISFKQYILENKAKKSSKENIEEPYKTPDDIKDIMSRSAGDDSISTDWGEHHTSADQGERRGAESIDSVSSEKEDVTSAMKAEREKSSDILSSSKKVINTDPNKRSENVYSNEEIARILNSRGIKTERGKQFSKQLVDQIAQQALAKLKKQLSGTDLDPHSKHLDNDIESH